MSSSEPGRDAAGHRGNGTTGSLFRPLVTRINTHFFYKNLVYKNIQAQMTENIFQKTNDEIFVFRKSMSSDSTHREKPFKHIFGGRGSGKSPKTGLKFKNISGSEKIKVFL